MAAAKHVVSVVYLKSTQMVQVFGYGFPVLFSIVSGDIEIISALRTCLSVRHIGKAVLFRFVW